MKSWKSVQSYFQKQYPFLLAVVIILNMLIMRSLRFPQYMELEFEKQLSRSYGTMVSFALLLYLTKSDSANQMEDQKEKAVLPYYKIAKWVGFIIVSGICIYQTAQCYLLMI